MILFAVIVLSMEKLGGMNSVVLSDAVQAILMIFGFFAIAAVVAIRFGTLGELAPADCPTLGYVNDTDRALLRELQQYDVAPMQCSVPPPVGASECVAFGCIS